MTTCQASQVQEHSPQNDSKALPILVGHPLLFLKDSMTTPVELVKGEPEVRLRSRKRDIHISIHPFPLNNYDTVCVFKETPSRFKLICFSAEHLRIAELMGEKGLKLPETSQEMTSRAVASLS